MQKKTLKIALNTVESVGLKHLKKVIIVNDVTDVRKGSIIIVLFSTHV